MRKIIECISKIDEQAHITGVALIPRISRNNNLYTKKELARFDNKQVPLNWEHDPNKVIGNVTFHFNPELETVYYEGDITDNAYATLAKSKQLFTSIEADVTSSQTICNGDNDCFSMPYGLMPEALALTEMPGVPETSVKVIEHIIKENCMSDCLQHKAGVGKDPQDPKNQAICHSECENTSKELKQKVEQLEKEIIEMKKCPKCHGYKK